MFEVIRSLFSFTRPYPLAIPSLVGLGLLASVMEGVSAVMLVPFLGTMLPDQGTATAAPGPLLDLLGRYAAMFGEDERRLFLGITIFCLIALKACLRGANAALSAWVNARVSHDLRRGLVDQLLTVGYGYVVRSGQGQLLNTLNNETWRTSQAIGALTSMIISASTVLVLTTMLLLISWETTLSVAAGVALAAVLVRSLARHAHSLGNVMVEANSEMSERALRILSGMRLIRAFGLEQSELAQFEKSSNRVRASFFRMDVVAGLVNPLMEVLYVPLFLGGLMVAWYAGVALPTLLVFLILLYRMQPHLRNIDRTQVELGKMAGAVAAVTETLDPLGKPYIRSGTKRFDGLKQEIAFCDVSFRYDETPATRDVLNGVSFEIRKREVTALIGRSGAGKSTVANLLYRFYDPTEGDILIDGTPLCRLDLATWRRRIALAGQDIDLLRGTIGENIAFGRADADEADIAAAARNADAADFIEALPLGYDTFIGDQGSGLSGGQRQRIGLARALLREPDILILDEATNAIDLLSESFIQDSLDRLAGRTTIVVIAHRWRTFENADRIVLLDQGRVAEQGSPRALARASGAFNRLYGVQASPVS